MINVHFVKTSPKAVIPTHAKEGDAGYDITAVDCYYDSDLDAFIYNTGLRLEFRKGIQAEIRPRSSIRKVDAIICNSPSTGDSGYRGNYAVTFKLLRNKVSFIARLMCKSKIYGLYALGYKLAMKKAPYKAGERIAQFVFVPYEDARFVEEDELSSTDRAEGGHGSSGK